MITIPIYERVSNKWLKKLLYERERIIREYRGRYDNGDVIFIRQLRLEKLESIINKYGE